MTKTDEDIINESLKCSKMYAECVKEAIEKARASEREKVAKEIFDELNCKFLDPCGRDCATVQKQYEGITWCEVCKCKQKYLGKTDCEYYFVRNNYKTCSDAKIPSDKWCKNCIEKMEKNQLPLSVTYNCPCPCPPGNNIGGVCACNCKKVNVCKEK